MILLFGVGCGDDLLLWCFREKKKNLGKQYTGHGLADWMKQGKEKKRHIPEFDVAHILVQHCSCTGQTHLFSYLNSSQCSPGTVPELGSQVIQIICILSLLSSTPLHSTSIFPFSPLLFSQPCQITPSLTERPTLHPPHIPIPPPRKDALRPAPHLLLVPALPSPHEIRVRRIPLLVRQRMEHAAVPVEAGPARGAGAGVNAIVAEGTDAAAVAADGGVGALANSKHNGLGSLAPER